VSPLELVERSGPALVAGATALLALGAIAVARLRTPAERQRAGELALLVALLWAALALLPFPRLLDPAPYASAPARAEPLATLVAAVAEPALPVSAPAAPAIDPARALAVVFLAGAALALLSLAAGFLRLARILRAARPALPGLERLLGDLAGPGAPRPRLLVTGARARPFCWGWRRPVIVLPERLCAPDLADALPAVLAHELSHARRRDGLGQALYAAALPLLFFHPLYWWLRARVRLAAELIADDRAALDGRAEYARRMIRLAEADAGLEVQPLAVPSGFRSPSEFYRRMKMLLEREDRLPSRCSQRSRWYLALGAGVLLVASGLLWRAPEALAQATVAAQAADEPATPADGRQELLREIAALRARLEQLERAVQAPAPPVQRVQVQPGDTLTRLWRRYCEGPFEIEVVIRMNPELESRRLRVGQEVNLPAQTQLRTYPAPAAPGKGARTSPYRARPGQGRPALPLQAPPPDQTPYAVPPIEEVPPEPATLPAQPVAPPAPPAPPALEVPSPGMPVPGQAPRAAPVPARPPATTPAPENRPDSSPL
jgi:beta-lactamase regulating signal transducer with metallopeptidase domain